METRKQTKDSFQDGEAIRRRVARAIAEAPHNDIDYYNPFATCEACAVLDDSLKLLASLGDRQ
jgi:hypothetical protein